MSSKKIKVFLGGFVNFTNAQNLNCLALARHLDKEKFNCFALEIHSGKLHSQKGFIPGLRIFHCFRPSRISLYLGFLWGIWHCDVAYLPKGELWKWNRFLLKLFRKKSFSTLEGIMDETALNNALSSKVTLRNYIESRSYFDKQYSITNYMRNYNFEKIGISTEKKILYLGVDSDFIQVKANQKPITKVLMIGNDLVRKGVFDYFKIASNYPNLTFYLAGSGNGKIDLNAEINKLKLRNVIYKGSVTTDELKVLLNEVQLHMLPSRSEGFPKVTLETAAAGVPSIVYDDYGAQEWITSGVNGWVVKTIDDMISIIEELISDPQKLEAVSHEAIKLAHSFDWKVKVKDWEEVIEELCEKSVKLN